MEIREYQKQDKYRLLRLIAEFRIALARLKSLESKFDLKQANEELEYYLEQEFPILIAEGKNDSIIGYSVCRIQDDVVWNEALFVVHAERRKGVATSLFKRSEEIAHKYDNETLYNWVHPNNDASINFLKKQGYNVLNLIEVRKERSDDNLTTNIEVDNHKFRY